MAFGQLSKIVEGIITIIFLSISLNMCFGCSKEPSHRDGSFEYPQHMFWMRNKKNNFQLRSLIWGPDIDVSFVLQYCMTIKNICWKKDQLYFFKSMDFIQGIIFVCLLIRVYGRCRCSSGLPKRP